MKKRGGCYSVQRLCMMQEMASPRMIQEMAVLDSQRGIMAMSESQKDFWKTFAAGFGLATFLLIGSGAGWTIHARRNPQTTAAIACQAGYTVERHDDENCRTLIDNYAP